MTQWSVLAVVVGVVLVVIGGHRGLRHCAGLVILVGVRDRLLGPAKYHEHDAALWLAEVDEGYVGGEMVESGKVVGEFCPVAPS